MNTPTPETDAHQSAMESEDFDVELAKTYSLARRLERERDEARAEIQAMRAAIVEAGNALLKASLVHLAISTYAQDQQSESDKQANRGHCEMLNAALAKLQPFLP